MVHDDGVHVQRVCMCNNLHDATPAVMVQKGLPLLLFPPEALWSTPHTLPQAPQLSRSVRVFCKGGHQMKGSGSYTVE